MEDSPGLQVRDCLFDSPADFVDGGVELLLPVEKFAVWWFFDRSDHVEADVAFVADPVLGVDPVEDAREAQRGAVVAAAVDGVGDPTQPAGQVADDLDVQAGRVVLAGVELWVVVPAPAADQGAIDDQLLIAGQLLGGRGELTRHPCQRRCDRRDRPGDRRLGHSVVLRQFLLHVISPQIGQRDRNGFEQAQNRRVIVTVGTRVGRIDKRAQVGDLVFAEACGMVHAAGRLSESERRNSILSKFGPSSYATRRR